MGFLSLFKKDKPPKRMAIIDVSDGDFRRQVLQRSYKTTVVVDFWAAWCGPCRRLGPVLEGLAEEADSEFILAKLDTEANRRTAAQYNIYSIPHVKAFRNGQIVDEFTGALPGALVRRFVDKVTSAPLPAPQIQISADPSKRIEQAEAHLKKGRGFEAFVTLSDFPDGSASDRASRLLPLAQFMVDMDLGDGLTGLADLDKEYLAAAKALRNRKPGPALNHLFAARQAGESMDQPYTSEVIESLFELLGDDHPLTLKFRPQLSSA